MSATDEGIKRALALAGICEEEAVKVTLPGELAKRLERSNPRKVPLGDYMIEIIEAYPHKKRKVAHQPGIHSVTMRVPDLNAVIQRLKTAVVRLIGEPQQGGHLYVFVHPAGTGGVLLELIQQ